MECKDVRELLTLHLLGDLEGPRAERVEAHLRDCDACRAERERLSKALSALRGLEEVPPSAGRRARLLVAAQAEGLIRRPWVLRLAPAWAALAAAAAFVALVSVIGGGPSASPPPDPVGDKVVMGGEPPAVPAEHFCKVVSFRGMAGIVRQDGETVSEPRPHMPLFAGDTAFARGKDGALTVRFNEDVLELTLVGSVPGGTEVRLGGVSEKDYEIVVERGEVRGLFQSSPLERQPSRRLKNGVVPLKISSPVARVEMDSGQEFVVRQHRVDLWKDYFESSPGADTRVRLWFETFPLSRLFERHLDGMLATERDGRDRLLAGRTTTLFGNRLDRAGLRALVERALAMEGLGLSAGDGAARVVSGEGTPSRAAVPAAELSLGAFELRLVDGSARLFRSRAPTEESVRLFGGQAGRVWPGERLEPASVELPRVVSDLEGSTLAGTMGWAGGRAAVLAPPGAAAAKVLELGDRFEGWRLSWVDWDAAVFTKEGREVRLQLPEEAR